MPCKTRGYLQNFIVSFLLEKLFNFRHQDLKCYNIIKERDSWIKHSKTTPSPQQSVFLHHCLSVPSLCSCLRFLLCSQPHLIAMVRPILWTLLDSVSFEHFITLVCFIVTHIWKRSFYICSSFSGWLTFKWQIAQYPKNRKDL